MQADQLDELSYLYIVATVDSLNIRHIKKKFVSPNFNRELETNWLNKKRRNI